jgi:hypothetical protein
VLRLDREDPPRSGDAFELMLSSVEEDLIGADDEVPDGAADQHLARAGEAADARTDMNSEAADVAIGEQLTFAGVQTGANVQPELSDTVTNGDRAADCSAWAVERGEHPITERLDELPR